MSDTLREVAAMEEALTDPPDPAVWEGAMRCEVCGYIEAHANHARRAAALSGSTAPLDAQCEFGHRPVVGLCSMGHPLIAAASPDPAQGGDGS